MFLRYDKKFAFLLAITVFLISNLFWATKTHRDITIPQTNDIPATKPVYPQTSLDTPFDAAMKISETSFPDRICNILDYGAVPGGKIKNTEAFEKTISDCAEKGGGKVEVPAGIWLVGPIKLKSNINLEIQKDANVIFSDDFDDYLPPVFSRFEGVEYYNYSPPIYANNAENIAITGEGTLDGQGQAWWNFSGATSIAKLYAMGEKNLPVEQRVFATPKDGLRPSFIELVNCDRIFISGVSILKGPMWTIHPIYSQNIIIKGVTIDTAPGPSTDGVVIDSSKNVLVDNTTFSTGDDAIVIKSGRDNDGRRINIPSENIVLQNITVTDAHGAIAIGSEMSGNVKNVLAQNFTVKNAQYGFRIKSNQQRGGTAENIWIKNLQINSLSEAVIEFDTYYERANTFYRNFPPAFQNINIEDVNCRNTKDSIIILGLKEKSSAINNLNLKNISIIKSRSGMKMNDAQNINLENIKITPKYRPVFNIENSQDVTMPGSGCEKSSIECFYFAGENLKNILLDKNNFLQEKNGISFGEGVDKSQIETQE